MFTGLVEQVGRIAALSRVADGGRIDVDHGMFDTPLRSGDSVAVAGVCLTVKPVSKTRFRADLLAETFLKTKFSRIVPGARVNIERPIRAGGHMGGHFVTGHIDGTGRVASVRAMGRDKAVRISCRKDILADIVVKGSIAVNGVSLTVVALSDSWFEFHMIPVTSGATTLDSLKPGELVNIETDILAKHVRRVAKGSAASGKATVTEQLLRDSGIA